MATGLSFDRWIAVLSLVLTVSAFDNAPPLMDPMISTLSPHHAKTSDSCVGQCAFIFIDEMSAQLGGGRSAALLNLNYNEFLAAFSNATFFQKFCELYHGFSYCYTKCPQGYMQELLQRSSEIIDHFCVYNYKTILEKFGCLAALDRNVSKQCLKSCTAHHSAVTSLMQNFKQLVLNGDSTQAEKYLGNSCEYVICTLHCDVPTIAHICDFDTADLVINLTKKSFDSMQRMTMDTGAVSKWPPMCADIKTYSLPKAPQSPPNEVLAVVAQSPSVPSSSSAEQEAAENDAEAERAFPSRVAKNSVHEHGSETENTTTTTTAASTTTTNAAPRIPFGTQLLWSSIAVIAMALYL